MNGMPLSVSFKDSVEIQIKQIVGKNKHISVFCMNGEFISQQWRTFTTVHITTVHMIFKRVSKAHSGNCRGIQICSIGRQQNKIEVENKMRNKICP